MVSIIDDKIKEYSQGERVKRYPRTKFEDRFFDVCVRTI